MIKNNDRWGEKDLGPIAEYCSFSGISASMCQESRDSFNSWAKIVSQTYPKEGTV